MEDKTNHYEIIFSKSKKKIIYGSKTYFGSIFNPEKEAKNLVLDYEEKIKKNKNILILGLASGYHIVEIEKLMKKYHHDFLIYVLEPSDEIINLNKEIHLFNEEKIKIIQLSSQSEVFNNVDFIMFLNEHPVIMKQPVSFLKFSDIFKKFLTYRASSKVNEYTHMLPTNLKNYLEKEEDSKKNQEIFEYITSEIPNKKKITSEDIFLLSFNEIINSESQTSSSQ
ncbi:hypothetical protein N9N67_00660 [Bacteriovoracaceae bacterium]|nr:hypothetical protein [Bacteriovoracaceae bacterium]